MTTIESLSPLTTFYKVKTVFIHPLGMTANLLVINILPNLVADIYIKLKSITSKLPNTLPSITFNKKTLFVDVMPIVKRPIVKGQFINEIDNLTAARKLMKIHLTKHV